MQKAEGAPIGSVEDAVRLAIDYSRVFCWYRGQEDGRGLVPSLYRPADGKKGCPHSKCDAIACRKACPARNEPLRTTEFVRRAPLLMDSIPAENDHFGWLLWMQHYGVPTRLLDWSESILPALFFAVSGRSKRDGALWCFHPGRFSKAKGFFETDRVATSSSAEVRAKAALAFGAAAPRQLVDAPGIAGPIPVSPPMVFHRITAQMGAFTLHDSPADLAADREAVKAGILTKHRIPAKAKETIRLQLLRLGVSLRTLFPDLQGLGQDVGAQWVE